jgi:excisionase family DNA binding protein
MPDATTLATFGNIGPLRLQNRPCKNTPPLNSREIRVSMSKDEHLSLGKVAKRCNVSRTTVYRWIVHGHLKAYALPSGHYRVRPDDLDGFCQSFGIPDVGKKQLRISGAKDGNRLQVLIADDHPDVVLLLRKVVERYLPNATIHEAVNGVDTCIAVGTLKPQILLLDIMMPGMDGFAVLQELLRRPELNGSQVVVVSAYEPFDRVEEMGRLNPQIAACVRKPVSVETLGRSLQDLAKSFTAG